MRNQNKLFVILILILFSINLSFAINFTHYEYVTSVKVNCDEYKGYSRFELPTEYNLFDSPKAYMNIDFYIENKGAGIEYNKNLNWYIKSIEESSISDVEKIYDSDFNSDFIIVNSSKLEFDFENPNNEIIDKITIDIKDSSLENIKIYDNKGKRLSYNLVKDSFHYELMLNEPLKSNFVKFEFEFNDVLKIRDISFYEKKEYESKSFVYFYINNNCDKTFDFYFGEFGENNAKIGFKNLPVEFEILTNTQLNPSYNNDFDSDSVLNVNDNCLNVANVDQKDINYNNIGDACEDDDRDGIVNLDDNCISVRNPNQLDSDSDGLGDACDNSDDRFFEKYSYIIYIFAGIIALIFVFFSLKMIKK